MAITIPRYDTPQVQTAPQRPVYDQRPDNMTAAALGHLAHTGEQVSQGAFQLMAQEREKADRAATDGAKAQVLSLNSNLSTQASAVTGRGVEPGYDEQGNKQSGTPGLTESYLSRYDRKTVEITSNLTPDQQEQLRPFLLGKRAELEHGLLRHEMTQRREYQRGQSRALLEIQIRDWQNAPPEQEAAARAQALATLAGLFTGEELKNKTQEMESAVTFNRVAGAMQRDPDAGRELLKGIDKTVLDDLQRNKLLDVADRRAGELAGQAHDNLFQNVMVPALEQKQFIPDLTRSDDYQTMRRFKPAAALAMLKNVEEHNAGLAVDHFDQWMTGLGSAARESLTFSRVPEQIRRELKEFSPKAYNALASRFEEERAIRTARAGVKESNREDWAMLNLTAMTRPDLIDDSSIIAGIQSGAIPAQKGMALLTKLQKSRDVGGALRSKESGVAHIINAEADALVEGIRNRDKRNAAKRRIVGAVHDVLEDVFHSRSEVSPETVKNALAAMRRATVTTKGGLWSWDKQVPALLVDPDADVVTEPKYREAQKYYQGQRGLTPAQAAARFSLWRSLGKKTFPLIPER